jgi:Ala-tRNA(Pro) deacylase
MESCDGTQQSANQGKFDPHTPCQDASTMPMSPDQLLAYLADLGIAVTTVRHPPLYTVEESQRLRGEIAGAHTKNLFLRDRKDNHFLLTVGEEAQVDLKTIHHVIGASGKVSFGKPETLMEVLGVTPGAVTAFGIVNDVERRVTIVFDEALMESPLVNAHPLTNEATTTIGREDLMRFAESTGHTPLVLKLSR